MSAREWRVRSDAVDERSPREPLEFREHKDETGEERNSNDDSEAVHSLNARCVCGRRMMRPAHHQQSTTMEIATHTSNWPTLV